MWVTYFSSSKYVKEFSEKHGKPEIRISKRKFKTPEEARAWEAKFIKKVNAVKSPMWLNRGNAGKEFFNGGGYKHTELTRKKIGESCKGRPSWNKGKQFSEEHRKKLSESKKNMSEETRKKMGKAHKGSLNVFNITTKQIERVPRELYYANRNIYFTPNSKTYKNWKQKKNIETFFT